MIIIFNIFLNLELPIIKSTINDIKSKIKTTKKLIINYTQRKDNTSKKEFNLFKYYIMRNDPISQKSMIFRNAPKISFWEHFNKR